MFLKGQWLSFAPHFVFHPASLIMGMFYNVSLALFAAIGGFLFGYDSGVITNVLENKYFLEYFNPSDALVGAVVSTLAGGCFVGAASAAWLADHIGRKRTLQVGSLIAIVGCLLQCVAVNIGMLIAGRIVAGLAIGVLSMITPLYQVEISHPKWRGFMAGTFQQMLGFGFITANWVTYGTDKGIHGVAAWRLPLGLQMLPALILFIGMFYFPFSPRWLVAQGREEEAYGVLQKLHFNGENKEWLDGEFSEICEQIRIEKEMKSSRLVDLVNTRPMLRRTLIACGVQAFGQFTGINVINYYGPRMYRALGISDPLLIQSIYGVVGPIWNLFFIVFLVDRVGRKKPLLFGSFMLAACLAVETAINAQYPPDSPTPNKTAQGAGVAMFFIATSVFSVSYGPIAWTYVAEIFPMRTRAMGVAAATCTNWAFNVLFGQTSPIGLDNSAWKYYLLFVCLNVFSFFMVLLFFPETKGKTLEEMDELFGDQVIDHTLDSKRPNMTERMSGGHDDNGKHDLKHVE
ncbi:general substrate transporter [Ceratobasidium sp. AG-I]|nr:general substrate transporter [Ceratobasidium sp. AG-I]